jgi:hypothetical protein
MQTLARWIGRLALSLAILMAVLVWTSSASAYPWMIRKEYTTCNVCHADPSGGGLLTVYGRALGVSEMTMKYKTGDDDPGKVGNFLFGAFDLPEPLLMGADFRSLGLLTFANGQTTPRFILMQADVESQVSIVRFRMNGNLGFVHEGALKASITRGDDLLHQNRLVSRSFWMGVDVGKDNEVLIRAGRMNLPFGIRTLEHTSYTRKTTRTDTNDGQQYGAAVAFNFEKVRAEIMGIAGNFNIRPDDFRERGYSAYLEYSPSTKVAVGASSLITHANLDIVSGKPTWRQAHGLFGRFALGKAVVLMAEADVLSTSNPPANTAIGTTALVQLDMEAVQGLHFLLTGEMKDESFKAGSPGASAGAWAGLWWFFFPHCDFRIDGIYRNEPDPGGSGRLGIGMLLGQLHLYL